MSESLDRYEEYTKRMMKGSAINSLIGFEMFFVNPLYARLRSDLNSAASNDPLIQIKLMLTTADIIQKCREEKPHAFDLEEINLRADQIANKMDIGKVLEEFDLSCQRRYGLSNK